MCRALGAVLATGMGALRVAGGDLAATELFVVLFLSVECFRPLLDLNKYWHQSFLGFAAARGIFALLDEPVVIREKLSSPVPAGAGPPSLEFKKVLLPMARGIDRPFRTCASASNPASGSPLWGNPARESPPWSTCCLRFFDPQKGQILLNDRDLKEYPPLGIAQPCFRCVPGHLSFLRHGGGKICASPSRTPPLRN